MQLLCAIVQSTSLEGDNRIVDFTSTFGGYCGETVPGASVCACAGHVQGVSFPCSPSIRPSFSSLVLMAYIGLSEPSLRTCTPLSAEEMVHTRRMLCRSCQTCSATAREILHSMSLLSHLLTPTSLQHSRGK